MNKMPINSVKAVFQANQLPGILQSVKVFHRKKNQTELELLVDKIANFPQNGNFLTEKLQRSAVLDVDRVRGRVPNNKRMVHAKVISNITWLFAFFAINCSFSS